MSSYLEQRRAIKLGIKDPELKPAKELNKESEKQKSLTKQYLKDRKEWMKKNKYCVAKFEGCTKMSSDLHHAKGRGEYLLDQTTWRALCRNCHQRAEENPELAKSLGLSESRLAITIHDQVEQTKVTIKDKI